MAGQVADGFLYNYRVALALVPCLLVAASIGGQVVMATLAVGIMAAYSLDALQLREGAFTAIWATLGLADMALVGVLVTSDEERPLYITMGFAASVTVLFVLVGMWASLQFKWVQLQYPGVVVVFERHVITTTLPLAAIVLVFGLATVVELSEIPYYLAALLCGMYHLLGRPLNHSFHRPRGGTPMAQRKGELHKHPVQTKTDGFLMSLLTVALPAVLYACLHIKSIFQPLHFWSVVLLASVPLLYIALVPDGLWWTPGGQTAQSAIRRVVVVLSALAVIAGLEGRVVFYSFNQYIKLHPPWNYLAVTVALLGVFILLASIFHGIMDTTLVGILMLLCTTAGCLAAGIPFHWFPAPLLSACGLALYLESGSIREYLVFVVGAMATAIWFVRHHYGFLDVILGSTGLQLSLTTFCRLLLVVMVPALLVPGMMMARVSKRLMGTVLLVQACLVSLLEEQLYEAGHDADEPSEVMYPGYLVVLTSVLGLTGAYQLGHQDYISHVVSWAMTCMYGAKVAMLVLPEAQLVLPTCLVGLAVSAPLYLHHHADEPGKRRLRLPRWVGWTHVGMVVLSVLLARFALFDVLQWLLSRRPPEGVLLGALVVTTAAGCFPTVIKCFAGQPVARRWLAAVAVSGVMLILLNPPVPIRGGAACPRLPLSLCPRLWDERHVPLHVEDDIAIWSSMEARRDLWPKWLLFLATLLGLSAITGSGPSSRSSGLRVTLALVAGGLVGQYVALSVVPGQGVLQFLVLMTSVLVVVFLALLQVPQHQGAVLMSSILVVWAALTLITVLLQAAVPPPNVWDQRRFYPDSVAAVENEAALATRAALLGVFACHSLLLAFALKLRAQALRRREQKMLGGLESPTLPSFSPLSADSFCSLVPSKAFDSLGRMLKLDTACNAALLQLKREGVAWVLAAGNLLTLMAVGVCLALNHYVTGGAPEAIFMMAPLLLLLNQDTMFFSWLNERHRYFPPVLAVSVYLVSTSAIELLALGVVYRVWAYALKNLVLLGCCVPMHGYFLFYMWHQKAASSSLPLLALLPLSTVPLVFADMQAVQYLALTSLVMGLLHYFSNKHIRYVGMRMI